MNSWSTKTVIKHFAETVCYVRMIRTSKDYPGVRGNCVVASGYVAPCTIRYT
jgi:hypothetical protein